MNVIDFIFSPETNDIGRLSDGDRARLNGIVSCLESCSIMPTNRMAFVADYSRRRIVYMSYRNREYRNCDDRILAALRRSVRFSGMFVKHAQNFLRQASAKYVEICCGGLKYVNIIFNTVIAIGGGKEKYPICIKEYPLFKTASNRVWCSIVMVGRYVNDTSEVCGIYNKNTNEFYRLDGKGRLNVFNCQLASVEEKVCAMLYANYSAAQIADALSLKEHQVAYMVRCLRRRFNASTTQALLVVLRVLELV